MEGTLHRFKPAAPVRIHMVLAGLLWSVVGTLLALFGTVWIWSSGLPHAVFFSIAAVVIGLVKSRLVLDKAARRIAQRIEERGDGRCVGGFLSLRTWLLVGLMAGGGRALRAWVLPLGIAGLLYLGIGVALASSSRLLWVRWVGLPG
jgi:hypothetical protein